MNIRIGYWVIFCTGGLAVLAACGGENTSSNVAVPGADESAKTVTLEAGATCAGQSTAELAECLSRWLPLL